jgi:hypothetical protein
MTQATTSHAKSNTQDTEMESRSSEEFDIEEHDPLAPNGNREASAVQGKCMQETTSRGNQSIPLPESTVTISIATTATTQDVSAPSSAYKGAASDNGTHAINATILVVAYVCLLIAALTVSLAGPDAFTCFLLASLCVLGPSTAIINLIHGLWQNSEEAKLLATIDSPVRLEGAEIVATLQRIRQRRASSTSNDGFGLCIFWGLYVWYSLQ